MNSETDIALIKKDMKYLKEGLDEIKESLKCGDTKYTLKTTFDDMYNKELIPLIKIKDKVIWLVVSSVIVALLSIVLSNGVFAR